jgi:hypothetical protein
MTTTYKLVFILSSKSNKQLDEDTNRLKMLIKSSGEVVTGAVCFKGQRQLTAYIKFRNTLNRLLMFRHHKNVNISILSKS